MSKSSNALLLNNSNNKTKLIKNKVINPNLFQVTHHTNKDDQNLNISGPLKGEKDPEKQLLDFFKDKKIYIEIFNDDLNSSQTFYNLLLKYKIIQCKKLSKKIDYIIFKDGHLKTKKYAILNNIKLVNPLWVDDKINHHIFKDDKEYEVKTNFGDISLLEKYEKNKKDENMNNKEEIPIKNYELELEPEYDREYANKIDKLRESYSQNNNTSEITTINDDIYDNNLIEMEDNTKKDNSNAYIEIKREKRISIDTKLENRKTIMNIKEINDQCNNQIKVSASRNSNSNKREIVKNTLSKENHKDKQKKRTKKNKKAKSVDNSTTSNKNKNSQKTSEKKKKKESNDNNYILEINQNSNNVLGLTTNKDKDKDKDKNEIQINSGKINILTYKLEEKEIQCLKEFKIFEYKGNLNRNINNIGFKIKFK